MSENKPNSGHLTVYDATYNLLRKLGLTTIFGNPGSTEQPFLKNFPKDFQYVLGLQEASAVAMADGFAQATRKPVLVNLHTSAGTGNGMGNIMTAYQNKTPLIITAGQQTREMVLCEPLLTNRDETMMPRPWVKWAYQPVRAQDVPAAIMKAYAIALQPPAGPVYVSIPLDDWDQPALGDAVVRTVSDRFAPDPARLAQFAERIRKSKNPALVYGQEIERSGGWDEGIKFAEQLRAPVFLAPLAERASFPQTHPQFRGMLPIAIAPLSKRLKGHDLVIVIGAPIFRYYPYIAGDYLPEGAELLQITSDPADAGAAAVGDSLLADAKLALEALIDLVPKNSSRPLSTPLHVESKLPSPPNSPLTALEVFAALSELRPKDAILVQETASNSADLLQCWPDPRAGLVLHVCKRRFGLEYSRGSGNCLGSKEKRQRSPCCRGHRRRSPSVLSSEPIHGSATEVEADLHCALQCGVRHPERIRSVGKDSERAGTRFAGFGYRIDGQRVRLHRRPIRNDRGDQRGVHDRPWG
jgi:benzoylformate decarboxylase